MVGSISVRLMPNPPASPVTNRNGGPPIGTSTFAKRKNDAGSWSCPGVYPPSALTPKVSACATTSP